MSLKSKISITPQEYFAYMQETTLATEGYLISKINSTIKNSDLYNLITETLNGRINTGRPKIRPGLTRLGYEVIGGKNWGDIVPLCAAVELLNISTYTINRIFDRKGGNWDTSRINNNIIAGFIQRELVESIVSDLKCNHENIIFELSEINNTIYAGQYIDLNVLQISQSIPPRQEYEKQYYERCYFFGGKFYEKAITLGAKFLNINDERVDALSNFGRKFGTSLQMVNDIGDFVPSTKKPYEDAFKYYQDQYSDLRNGKLTLPIYLILQNSTPKDKEFTLNMIGKEQITLENGQELTNILLRSGAVKECKKIVKSYINDAKRDISIFPYTSTTCLLSATTSACRSSVYWKVLKEID